MKKVVKKLLVDYFCCLIDDAKDLYKKDYSQLTKTERDLTRFIGLLSVSYKYVFDDEESKKNEIN